MLLLSGDCAEWNVPNSIAPSTLPIINGDTVTDFTCNEGYIWNGDSRQVTCTDGKLISGGECELIRK